MRKIISLIIIGMLTIGMVGCGKDYVLQEQIDVFKAINNQEINTNSMEDYYNSFDIEGLEIKYYPSVKQMWFKVELNEEIYHQFLQDVEAIGLEKAREKYGVNILNEIIMVAYVEQQKIVNEIDEDWEIYFLIGTDEFCDNHYPVMISVYDGMMQWNNFNKIK